MRLSAEDRVFIKVIHEEKGFGARKIVKEFPNKNWCLSSVNRLLRKIRETGSVSRRQRINTKTTQRIQFNIDKVNSFICSQQGQTKTHLSLRQIAKQTGISRTTVYRIKLKLKYLRRLEAHRQSSHSHRKRLEISKKRLQSIRKNNDESRKSSIKEVNERLTGKGHIHKGDKTASPVKGNNLKVSNNSFSQQDREVSSSTSNSLQRNVNHNKRADEAVLLAVNGVVQPPYVPPLNKCVRNTNHLHILSGILKEIWNYPCAYPFLEPVDNFRLKLSDYYDIIKHPMDLGTIKKRLENMYYYSGKDCIEDFKLMFNNAFAFNPPNNDVTKIATYLEHIFLAKVSQLPEEEVEIPAPTSTIDGLNCNRQWPIYFADIQQPDSTYVPFYRDPDPRFHPINCQPIIDWDGQQFWPCFPGLVDAMPKLFRDEYNIKRQRLIDAGVWPYIETYQ